MDVKQTTLGTVLCIRKHLTLPEVGHVSQDCCSAILDIIDRSALTVTGPWHFVSYGLPDDTESEFEIEFCLPVVGDGPEALAHQAKYHTLPAFRCATRQYSGELSGLFEHGYRPLLEAIKAEGYELTGESREVYHQWFGPGSADNVIEIQFGIRDAD